MIGTSHLPAKNVLGLHPGSQGEAGKYVPEFEGKKKVTVL